MNPPAPSGIVPHMPTDVLAGDLGTLTNDDLYAAIVAFSDAQPNEGWLHDYTETWDDAALTKIAAFANTFGGVLIVGVRKKKSDVKCYVVGTQSNTEHKTKVASSIAANISPTPPYDIFECHEPGQPTKRFCVVRVRSSKALYLITKKGFQPVYVRNEDEARPADAAQLRALIERQGKAPTDLPRLARQAEQLRDALNLRRNYKDTTSETWFLSASDAADTFLKLELIPSQRQWIDVEASHENRFRTLVASLYPRIAETRGGVAKETSNRGADYYEYVWYHTNIDFEARWRITGTGEVAQANRIEYQYPVGPGEWSIVDLAFYVIQFARLGAAWWQSLGYFGDGRLLAQLTVNQLKIARGGPGGPFIHAVNLMHPRVKGATIPVDAIAVAVSSRTAASADLKWDYFSASAKLGRITTALLNQLLRGLGHSVLWQRLEEAIQVLVDA
jgi:Schlafen, AlbA_2